MGRGGGIFGCGGAGGNGVGSRSSPAAFIRSISEPVFTSALSTTIGVRGRLRQSRGSLAISASSGDRTPARR